MKVDAKHTCNDCCYNCEVYQWLSKEKIHCIDVVWRCYPKCGVLFVDNVYKILLKKRFELIQ